MATSKDSLVPMSEEDWGKVYKCPTLKAYKKAGLKYRRLTNSAICFRGNRCRTRVSLGFVHIMVRFDSVAQSCGNSVCVCK